ncbi:major facilitator superfamily domain-containing protein 12-like [Leptopilina heterotoma]|uniref:major facilitator superfamily domain-containing protein 12-like n=1 Tax=Leptopilina heterotoma TaxID=63436 RepID=UPI001CA8517A|nr:major facilitator superfamily domain-containing protein 12-like [Leptopilina heterotoma]XP_043484160.1 major facilitator superfamily domain-containing protein 12-like [Leptopilina heterotoma]XP_043484161.1 major facilitator superfamily domain-containing protein 12-like [Leptopilina heterotoma]
MEPDHETVTRDYTEVIRRLSWPIKLGYGTGHVLNDICASMWFSYLLVYFHLVLGFSPLMAGVILLIGQVADALATPFVGYHSDNSADFWLCRYGKRKTWHLLGTFCVVFAFPFIFSPCIGCKNAHEWSQLIYYAAFVVIFQFGWASVQISHLSLIPDLTPTEHERTELTAIRYSFTVFANVLVYCIFWAVLHVTSEDSATNQIGPKDVSNFQTIVNIGIAVGVIASAIFHIVVKEETSGAVTGASQQRTRSISELFKDLQLYKVAALYMSTRLFLNLTQIYVPLYLHETLHMAATSLAIIPLIMYLSSFKASLIVKYLNSKFGRKIAYTIGVVLALFACGAIKFGHGDFFVSYGIYPVSLMLGSAGSFMLVTSLGITADYIGEKAEGGAFIYGLMSFTDKLSNGLVVIVIQFLKHKGQSPDYYCNILTFVCGGSALFALIILLFIKPFQQYSAYRNINQETLDDDNTTIQS